MVTFGLTVAMYLAASIWDSGVLLDAASIRWMPTMGLRCEEG